MLCVFVGIKIHKLSIKGKKRLQVELQLVNIELLFDTNTQYLKTGGSNKSAIFHLYIQKINGCNKTK